MSSATEDTQKSKKPSDSAFKQQRLPAWQPILTAGTVLPFFFLIGIAFIPVGIALHYLSDQVQEYTCDYTECESKYDANLLCAEEILKNQSCTCEIEFNLTSAIESKVYLYYGLTNFYQNHRRYVKSRDDNQLLGELDQTVSSDCEPFAYVYDNEERNTKKPIAPCGAIANSLFNDSFKLEYRAIEDTGEFTEVKLLNTEIAWPSDKDIKFKNPGGDLEDAFKDFAKPPNWRKNIWELDPDNPENNGFQNEDLIVWMRTAALPTFRKLHRRIDHSVTNFKTSLPKGQYRLTVEYNYPVKSFEGTKSIILSNTSILGGKNNFLGIAYIVVGCICLVMGVVFSLIHFKYGRRSVEMDEVSQSTTYYRSN